MSRKLELITFKAKECLVIIKDVDCSDLNFKKTAKTWLGKYVYPLKQEWGNSLQFSKGEILYIAIDENMGYKIRLEIFEKPELAKYTSDLEHEEYLHELFTLLVDGGYANIVDYDKLKQFNGTSFSIAKFETNLKLYRMWTCRGFNFNESLYYEKNYEIFKIEHIDKVGILLSVVNKLTRRQLPNLYIKQNDILNRTFSTDTEVLDGNPFNIKYSDIKGN